MKYLVLLLLSILGFSNALFLHLQYLQQKQKGKKMFCILGSDCGAVVASKYGKTFGIKNERIGFAYYTAIGILSAFMFVMPNMESYIKSLLIFVTLFASLFSIYLLSVQLFVLRKFCFLCFIAIIINIAMTVIAI